MVGFVPEESSFVLLNAVYFLQRVSGAFLTLSGSHYLGLPASDVFDSRKVAKSCASTSRKSMSSMLSGPEFRVARLKAAIGRSDPVETLEASLLPSRRYTSH
ncbi:hypothetical protein MRX96_057781 [Rhipicephalus microplus]